VGFFSYAHAVGSTNALPSEDKISSLSVEDRVGQLMMVGFYGTRIEDNLGTIINKFKPGSVITFSRNIRSGMQVANLNYAAQQRALHANGIPLLIAVDQEGGLVTRIKTHRPLPSAWSIGATQNPALAQQAGEVTAHLLRELGFNMDLAPVLDLGALHHDSFLGTRAFSANPAIVSQMSEAFAKGLRSQAVLPTAKHFPGHGGVAADSHHSLPIKTQTLPELMAQDLIPFKTWVRNLGDTAMMVAHIALPKIDASGAPATFSHILVDDILRHQLGYGGLVISDDLDMAGAACPGGVGESAIRAFESGVDILMVAWNRKSQITVFHALVAAIRSGRISEVRLNQSVARVLKAKRLFAGAPLERPSFQRVDAALRNHELEDLADSVSRTNFRIQTKGIDTAALHLNPQSSIVIVSYRAQFARAFASAKKFKSIFFSNPRIVNLQRLKRFIANGEGRVVVATIDGPGSSHFINALPAELRKRTLIINHESPSLIDNPESFAAVLNMGTFYPPAAAWTANFLAQPESFELRQPAAKEVDQ
jgi:beta-N-acetylhexosaminidase